MNTSSLLPRRRRNEVQEHFASQLIQREATRSRPAPYSPGLTPIVSNLRPHCLARERLRLWRPLVSRSDANPEGQSISLPEADVKRVFEVLSRAWADGTHETYGSGLLVYHVFCDLRNIPESQRAPASSILMSSFIASLAGSYSASAISNYVHGICAWHTLHGVTWQLDKKEMDALLKGAERLAPPSSKRKKRRPFTVGLICKVSEKLNLNDSFDAAVFACLTTCFYAAARLGEFTVPRLDSFNPTEHVTRQSLRVEKDRNGLEITVLHLPRTKSAQVDGEDVYWSRQEGPSDPYAALENHLRVNEPLDNQHLFTYKHKTGLRPLTKQAFLKRIATAARKAGEEPLQGHGIRIGATLEYLLRGVSFEAMKVLGRWASDAFIRYLRKHAQIMAPYIQANPELHQAFSHLVMSGNSTQGRR